MSVTGWSVFEKGTAPQSSQCTLGKQRGGIQYQPRRRIKGVHLTSFKKRSAKEGMNIEVGPESSPIQIK